MGYIKCPSCSGILVRREGPYGEFAGCNNFPNCAYSAKLHTFTPSERKCINYQESFSGFGECNRCGRLAVRDSMGHCDTCAVWYESQ